MKLNIALVMLVAIALLCGAAMADVNSATWQQGATVEQSTITITVPTSLATLPLTRGGVNEFNLAGVSISTTDSTKLNYELDISGGNGGFMISSGTPPVLLSQPFQVESSHVTPTAWWQLNNGAYKITGLLAQSGGTGSYISGDIPIRVKQNVVDGDSIGSYNIPLTFTVTTS